MMSDAVEKAFAAIPGLISGGLTTITAGSPIHVQGFPSFVHKVCSLTSKYEEEQVVKRELTLVKQRLAQPNITQAQQADCLVRLLFAHVLGYDVSFGYISAVKLAQQGTLAYKRMGYLACTLFLHENHELVLLLINTIQKDINSSNIMDVCMALTATCSLVNTEMIPAILPFVQEKLKHQKEIIRKKAVLCLFKFHRMAPNSVQHIHHSFKEALCDKDPGVMWSALHIYHDLIKHSPSEYQDITQSLVSILQQVVSRKLPADYEYHHVPAPWLQIKLLQVLALLGKDQQKISKVIHPVLAEVLQRSESNQNITFGVVYECILTITSISPDTRLLEYAAKCTGKFLRSKANNLRYLGIKALTKVIQVAPQHALDHQMTVIECLEDPDHTIRAKTLELLYRMCNSVNVKVICDKLLEYMEKDTEKSIKGDIASKISKLTEKYTTNVQWCIEIVNRMVLLEDSLVPQSTVTSLIQLVKDASLRGEDSVLLFAVQTYWELLQRKDVPNKLIQIGAWILGEYSQLHVVDGFSVQDLLQVFQRLLVSSSTSCDSKRWLLTAVTKQVLHCENAKEYVTQLAQNLKNEDDADIKQRLRELQNLCQEPMTTFAQVRTECQKEQEEYDFSLSFLDNYVSEALEGGAKAYCPLHLRNMKQKSQDTPQETSFFQGMNFLPYESPTASISSPVGDTSVKSGSSGGRENRDGELKLKAVKKLWGHTGRLEQEDEVDQTLYEENISEKWMEDRKVSDKSQDLSQSSPPSLELAEKRRKQELASALFGGITRSDNIKNDFIENPVTVPDGANQTLLNTDNTER